MFKILATKRLQEISHLLVLLEKFASELSENLQEGEVRRSSSGVPGVLQGVRCY